MKQLSQNQPSSDKPTRLTRIFFWLAGAGEQTLAECPNWERRKYVAFGATVLIPTLFAIMAATYCVSTLTDNWAIIVPVALLWAFIILTVDRALLTTYRAYQNFFRKGIQLSLRMFIAVLMGLTISHPLMLLLFRDTIQTSIEKDREAEIALAQVSNTSVKKEIEARISAIEKEIAVQRTKWDETFKAKFLVDDQTTAGQSALTPQQAKSKSDLDKKIEDATAPAKQKIAGLEKEIATISQAATKTQSELNQWQKEYERELNGQRSGLVGDGPRAKSIQNDQLAWRRTESQRQATQLKALTEQVAALRSDIAKQEQSIVAQSDAAVQEATLKHKEKEALREKLVRQVEQSQASSFVEQQNQIRSTLKAQIDTRLSQVKGLQNELAQMMEGEQARIAAIRAESRHDILTQTLALHKLFNNGAQGGLFALITYSILTLLFLMVDTIPLVVKFFSKPGPYDTLLDIDEIRYEKERESFLKSYRRYMDELASGRLLHLTRNKPLELALIEGIDCSRAAKEFLEHLLELEHTFNERILLEREALDAGNKDSGKAAMLDEMARAFYTDLRWRMERFFGQEETSKAVL